MITKSKYARRAKLFRELNYFYAVALFKERQKEYANSHDGVEYSGGFLVTWNERPDNDKEAERLRNAGLL